MCRTSADGGHQAERHYCRIRLSRIKASASAARPAAFGLLAAQAPASANTPANLCGGENQKMSPARALGFLGGDGEALTGRYWERSSKAATPGIHRQLPS